MTVESMQISLRVTMRLLSGIFIALCVLLSCRVLCAVEPWTLTEVNELIVLSASKNIAFNDHGTSAKVSFSSKGGRDGALELSFEILNVKECIGFGALQNSKF